MQAKKRSQQKDFETTEPVFETTDTIGYKGLGRHNYSMVTGSEVY